MKLENTMKSVINILLVCILALPVYAQLGPPYEWDHIVDADTLTVGVTIPG